MPWTTASLESTSQKAKDERGGGYRWAENSEGSTKAFSLFGWCGNNVKRFKKESSIPINIRLPRPSYISYKMSWKNTSISWTAAALLFVMLVTCVRAFTELLGVETPEKNVGNVYPLGRNLENLWLKTVDNSFVSNKEHVGEERAGCFSWNSNIPLPLPIGKSKNGIGHHRWPRGRQFARYIFLMEGTGTWPETNFECYLSRIPRSFCRHDLACPSLKTRRN